MNPSVSLIIPAYNEEARIRKSLESAVEYIEKNSISAEIIVVNDGSKDNTSQVVKDFAHSVQLIEQPKNMGKGAAVKTGMLAGKGEYRIFTDADFSTPIYEITKIISEMKNGTDVCIGSRAIDPSLIKEHQPFYREFMGKTYNKFVQLFLFSGIKDTQCGFKGFKAEAANRVFNNSKIDGFGFDVEILYLASKAGYKVKEVPVEWYNDERTTVSPIKDSLNMFFQLFTIKKMHKNTRF